MERVSGLAGDWKCIVEKKSKKAAVRHGMEAIANATFNVVKANSVSIANLDPNPNQPRREFKQEELTTLADSIMAHGVIQPISIYPNPAVPGRYFIESGERRVRASTLAGFRTIPAVLAAEKQDHGIRAIAENIHRTDLNPMDKALAFKSLLDKGMSQKEVAKALAIGEPEVSNHLRLLKTEDVVQKAVASGAIPMGVAKILPGVDADTVKQIVKDVSAGKKSVRDVEEQLREKREKSGKKAPGRKAKKKDSAKTDTSSIVKGAQTKVLDFESMEYAKEHPTHIVFFIDPQISRNTVQVVAKTIEECEALATALGADSDGMQAAFNLAQKARRAEEGKKAKLKKK